tara:strand:- start:981 stop:3023 length:2043 start_codon:yes stop_codon:yes gene_type:complete
MIKKLVPSLTLLLLLSSLFFLMYEINYISRDANILGGSLFLLQLPFFTIIKMLLLFLILMTLTRFIIEKYRIELEHIEDYRFFIYIVGFSLTFKLLLFDFNNDGIAIKNDLYRVFERGEFNQYKTYMYVVFLFNFFGDNLGVYLTYANSILSSMMIGIFFLLIRTMNLPLPVVLLSMILILSYIPLHANDMLLRVDVLFAFLFALFIYLLVKCRDSYTTSKLLQVNILAVILCFTRESIIYFLPIFILILATSNEKKILSSITLSITILTASSIISHTNKSNYGISSIVKDHHLILKMQYYGYLNQNIMNSYVADLSVEGKTLLNDIKASYDLNILPHKREPFDSSKFGILNNFTPDTPTRYVAYGGFILLKKMGLGGLIRPDVQNVLNKNAMTKYRGDLEKVKNSLVLSLDKAPNRILAEKIELYFADVTNVLIDIDDKNLSIYLSSLLSDMYLRDDNDIEKNTSVSCKAKNLEYNNNLYEKNCVVEKIQQISHNFLLTRSDNWSYKRASIPFVWKFDEREKYLPHPNINKTTEIILAIPTLYITQSIVTLFSMSGYVPIPSSIANIGEVYSRDIFPDFLLYKFQSIFQFLMNFWYVICFLVLIKLSLGKSNRNNIKNEIILLFIPLYYGFFIAFASPFEFNRLLMPITPFIFICFSILMHTISDIFYQPLNKFSDKLN